jgi:protoporphyrin/coproporphyrin ferrochelatase
MTATLPPTGILVMTYGSPSSLDDVGRYMTAVRGGREPGEELVAEFRRRYALIGGSPLVAITRAQAAALQARLRDGTLVRAAMRFSEPSIETGLRELAELGVRDVLAVVLSPQYSPLLMDGYRRAVEAARTAIGSDAPAVEQAGAWHDEPAFITALAGRVREGLASFDPDERVRTRVLLTAHSLPRRVADAEPAYLEQLRATATAVASAAGLDDSHWTFCWQSAGHEPGEWMKPDFAVLMPKLRLRGYLGVLVAPIQFLADHLEILYDIDIAAREQAEAEGLTFRRIASLNDDPQFIEALAQVALRARSAVTR